MNVSCYDQNSVSTSTSPCHEGRHSAETEFSHQSARFVSWLDLPRTKIWSSILVRLMVFAGLTWACHRHNFVLPDSSLRFFRSMLGLPQPWTECLARFQAFVCFMSKICWLLAALACLVSFVLCHLSPEVRWFGWIAWLGCLGACEMNGIYTSMFFAEMNIVPTFGGQQSCRTDSLYWTRRFFFVVQYWGDSERPFCFTCCFAVFVVSLLCF